MTTHPADVGTALATLRERWGAAAPRRGEEAYGGVVGALATSPLPVKSPADFPVELPVEAPRERIARPAVPGAPAVPVVSTGFPQLDALLGPGGIPRTATVALRGDASSGRTTVALRLVAEAQAAGSIVAWLDLERSLDPVEAAARGVRLEWLVVLAPADLDEGLSMAGALLQARAVDMLLVDLPARLGRPVRLAEQLGRLAAHARRAGVLLVVLEPPGRGRADGRGDLLGASAGLRLELARSAWIRLGRDVVGQWAAVTIERNRFGPPGGRTELAILYADGGLRDACLRTTELRIDGRPGRVVAGGAPPGASADAPPGASAGAPPGKSAGTPPGPPALIRPLVTSLSIVPSDAPPPPLLAAPSPPARPGATRARGTGSGIRGGRRIERGTGLHDGRCDGSRLEPHPESHLRVVPERAGRAGRPALDRRDGDRCGPDRPLAGRPAEDAAWLGPPARPGGDVPRPRA